MGVFSSIKNAIWGSDEAKAAEPKAGGSGAVAAAVSAAMDAAKSSVDVGATLDAKAAAHSENLNWKTSIVDLMKLVGLDSSYANRKELAQEMGRSDYEGSAEDNIWLHKKVLQELQANGGKVPADLL